MTAPRQCLRFERCNAPVCPLDRNWPNVPHLPGEPVCIYLREPGKQGGRARIATALSREHAAAVVRTFSELVDSTSIPPKAGYGKLRAKLNEAAKTGPMLGRVPGREPMRRAS